MRSEIALVHVSNTYSPNCPWKISLRVVVADVMKIDSHLALLTTNDGPFLTCDVGFAMMGISQRGMSGFR
jgi:hypothetical protein